jgi:hypothetical protein
MSYYNYDFDSTDHAVAYFRRGGIASEALRVYETST